MEIKPPIGLKPKSEADQERAIEIIEAMRRYVQADEPIPSTWIDEIRYLYGEE